MESAQELGGPVARAPDLADWALSRGIGSLTTRELARLLAVPEDQVRRRLHAPARRGQWVSPLQGLWIPVAPEYRQWGAPPGIEIVDAMMAHIGVRYYVGWLTAAAMHGAAHQAPQVFQVATDRHVRDRQTGRTRFQYLTRAAAASIPVVERQTRSGHARVSTPEATALDVATDLTAVAGLDHAATVIVELSEVEGFDLGALSALTPSFPAASARRVGWILEHFAGRDDLYVLRNSIVAHPPSPSRIDPTRPASGLLDRGWNLRINRNVEPDL